MNINRLMANMDNMARQNKFNVNIFGPSTISTKYKDFFKTGLRDSIRLGLGQTRVEVPFNSLTDEELLATQSPGEAYDRNDGMDEVVVVAKQPFRDLAFKEGTNNFSMRGLRCTNVSLPGRSFITTPHSTYAGGPKSNRIAGIEYDGGLVQMTFMCDHSFEDKQKLELWQQYIFDDAFHYQYYDDYVGRIEITQEGQDGLPIYSIELDEAYPQSIQTQTLDAANGEIQTFTCSFAFRSWSSQFTRSPTGILEGIFNKKLRKIRTGINEKLDNIFGDF